MTQNSFSLARAAQAAWAGQSVSERLRILRAGRRLIASRAAEFADSVQLPGRRNAAETLPMEVIPLLDAVRFLERHARRLLKPVHYGAMGRPAWLWGVSARVDRTPLGIVLIIGPFNYPLFLPGVQVLQALAAGNAVVVKPAPGHAIPMHQLALCLKLAGLPDHLLTVTETDISAVEHAFAAGVDKVILTGSAASGHAVMHMAADHAVPSIMELSGNDAVIVHELCDVEFAVRLLAYGLSLNGGATCIAPRRVFVAGPIFDRVAGRMVEVLATMVPVPVSAASVAEVMRLLDEARMAGSTVYGGAGSNNMLQPAIVIDPPPESGLLQSDLFAPVMSLIRFTDVDQMLTRVSASRYCLSISIFAPLRIAQRLAAFITVGTVVINDLIVPTADPRLPFEANGQSGFGATRGAEGLLAMTRSTSLIKRAGKFRMHASHPVSTGDAPFFLSYIDLTHARLDHAIIRRAISFVKEAVRMSR